MSTTFAVCGVITSALCAFCCCFLLFFAFFAIMRCTTFNAHEWFITVRFCVAVLLASPTLCDVVLFDSRRFCLYDFVSYCCYVEHFVVVFCSSKSAKKTFIDSLVVLCCASFIMLRTLCSSSNSSCFIPSVSVQSCRYLITIL